MKKLLFCLIVLFLSSCQSVEETKVDTYRFYAMDTMIAIQFYNVENSKEICDEIENIYLKYDCVASDYQTGNGEVSVYDLNEKRQATISDELLELIQFSLAMKEDTNGYFNPFIGKLTHAWKDALGEGKLLSNDVVEECLTEALNTSIIIEDHDVELTGNGNLDLGGIAKGYATYKAERYLKDIQCEHFLLNAGSSNLVLGSKLGEPFKVGLSQAYGNQYFSILQIKNACISTSSVREQHYLVDGQYYSHIINAKTGYPAHLYDTFSIVGSHSGILDAYSTACFCMELEEAKSFLSNKNLKFICSKDNQLYDQTEGLDNA